MANCGILAEAKLTVSSYLPTSATPSSSTVFAWGPAGGDAYSPEVSCLSISPLGTGNKGRGYRLRAAFNKTYTSVLAVKHDSKDLSNKVGWLGPARQYQQLSATVTGDFTKQDDRFPMYHPTTDRVYYWDMAQKPARLMSFGADGSRVRPEPELGKEMVSGPSVMANVTAPLVDDKGSGVVYNKAGTLAAAVVIDQLAVVPVTKRESLHTVTSGIALPIDKGTYNGSLNIAAFIDDNTVVLQDSKQIYIAKLSGKAASVTTVLTNDKLTIWDVTPSPDGATIAFMTGEAKAASLYSLSVAGGEPRKIASFASSANILEYSS